MRFLCWNITVMHNDYCRSWWEETWFWFFSLSFAAANSTNVFYDFTASLYGISFLPFISKCIACTMMFVCRRTASLRCLTYDFPEKKIWQKIYYKNNINLVSRMTFFLLFMSEFFDEILRNLFDHIIQKSQHAFCKIRISTKHHHDHEKDWCEIVFDGQIGGKRKFLLTLQSATPVSNRSMKLSTLIKSSGYNVLSHSAKSSRIAYKYSSLDLNGR